MIWACYAFFIGRLGGKAFETRPWAGLLLAFGVALAITGLTEAVRRIRPWRWFSRGMPERGPEPGAEPVQQPAERAAADANAADGGDS